MDGNAPQSQETAPANAGDASAGAALGDAMRRWEELKEYAAYYAAAKLDGYKGSARNTAVKLGIGLVAVVVVCVFAGTAVSLLLGGLAEGVGRLAEHRFGQRWYWLGPFLVGVIVLGGGALGAILGIKRMTRARKAQIEAKYAGRQNRQRVEYGHDVSQRAMEARDESTR